MKLPLTYNAVWERLSDTNGDIIASYVQSDDARRIAAAIHHADALAEALRRTLNVLRVVQPDDDALDDVAAVLAAYVAAKEAQL